MAKDKRQSEPRHHKSGSLPADQEVPQSRAESPAMRKFLEEERARIRRIAERMGRDERIRPAGALYI